MFDLDISKMLIVGIIALAVIPPKDLPRVMRTVGQTIGRSMSHEGALTGVTLRRRPAAPQPLDAGRPRGAGFRLRMRRQAGLYIAARLGLPAKIG